MRIPDIALLATVAIAMIASPHEPIRAAQCPAASHLSDDASGTSQQALVVPDRTELAESFSFPAVIEAIIKSAGPDFADTAPATFVKTLIDSFATAQRDNSGVLMDLDVRTEAAELKAEELLGNDEATKLFPVGLFNRLDLAPEHWGNCGEFRIVFARQPKPPQNIDDRFLLIFEAKLPSEETPGSLTLAQRKARCQKIATFWGDLAKVDRAAAIAQLKQFYFDGIALDGDKFPPVISARNLGADLGQVRGNAFMHSNSLTGNKWQLREWRVDDSGASLIFKPDTVKENALAEFYADAPADDSDKSKRWRAFHDDVIASYVTQLLKPDLAGKTAAADIVNGIGVHIGEQYNEFQSDSQGVLDEPREQAPAAQLRQRIKTKIAELGAPVQGKITVDHVLNRAGAMTCGGCHQFSAIAKQQGDDEQKEIAPDIRWPHPHGSTDDRPFGFVHISENAELSRALLDALLPGRMAMLKKAICEPPPVSTAVEATETSDFTTYASLTIQAAALRDGRGRVTTATSEALGQSLAEITERLRKVERDAPGALRPIRPVH